MSKQSKNREEILKGNILPTLFFLSLPIMLNHLLQTFYNISDSYFMGLLGGDGLAASAFTSPIFQVITSLGTGLSTGGMIIFSKNIGAGNKEENRRAKSQLILVNLFLGILLSFLTITFSKNILEYSGATGKLMDLSNSYMKVLFLAIPTLFITNSYSSIESSKGNTKKPMLLVFASTILNVIFNSLAVKFGLGIQGIAFATLVSSLILTSYCVNSLFKNRDIFLKYMKPDFKLAFSIVSLGVPVALSSAAANLGFVLLNRHVVVFGSEVLAAFGVGNRINNIFYTPANGISTGISIMVAQNLGAENRERVFEILKTSMKLSIFIATVGAFIIYITALPMARFFTKDPEIIFHANNYLKVFLYCNVAWGVYQVYSGFFLGIGLTKLNFYINLGRVWLFRVPILLLIERFFNAGAYSVWLAMLISNLLVMILAGYIYYKKYSPNSEGNPILSTIA